MWGHLGGPPLNSVAALTVASGVLTISLATGRRNCPSDLSASLLFAANLVPAYGLLWLSQSAIETQRMSWVPFEPHELSSLTVAMLAPPNLLIGAVAILVPLVIAFLQYSAFSPEQIARVPFHPLFAPVAFASFALVLYYFRLRGLQIVALAAKKEAEAQMVRAQNRTILAIKDLANSPIQALILDAETLKRKVPKDLPVVYRIENSVLQLRELSRVLDKRVRGTAEDLIETSFDPHAELYQTDKSGPKRHMPGR
ncbi:MAG: hypothetical protein ACXWPM_03170 [Bdellovibrionota bacterium]